MIKWIDGGCRALSSQQAIEKLKSIFNSKSARPTAFFYSQLQLANPHGRVFEMVTTPVGDGPFRCKIGSEDALTIEDAF